MHVPFRLPRAHRGKDFQIGVIQEIGSFLQYLNFSGRFHPAHLRHQGGAIHQPGPWDEALHLLPACGTDVGLLQANGVGVQAHLSQQRCHPLIGRLGVIIIHLDTLEPGVTPGQWCRIVIQDHHWLPWRGQSRSTSRGESGKSRCRARVPG